DGIRDGHVTGVQTCALPISRNRGRSSHMKLVVAIVRTEKLNDVLEALYRAEVRGLTISRVRGHGGEVEAVETYRGMTVKVELHRSEERRVGKGCRSGWVTGR